jgi:hypothetical protein
MQGTTAPGEYTFVSQGCEPSAVVPTTAPPTTTTALAHPTLPPVNTLLPPTPPVPKTRILASTHARVDRLQHAWLEQQAIRSLRCAKAESRRSFRINVDKEQS